MNVNNVIAIDQVKYDLDAGEEFYNLSEPGVGAYFRDCLISDIESLVLYAGIHSKHNGFHRMLSKRFPYAIYYDIKEETAIVVAVLDMRRNPVWLKKKIRKRSF